MSGTKPVYSPAARMELSSPRVEGTWLIQGGVVVLTQQMASFLQIHLPVSENSSSFGDLKSTKVQKKTPTVFHVSKAFLFIEIPS